MGRLRIEKHLVVRYVVSYKTCNFVYQRSCTLGYLVMLLNAFIVECLCLTLCRCIFSKFKSLVEVPWNIISGNGLNFERKNRLF